MNIFEFTDLSNNYIWNPVISVKYFPDNHYPDIAAQNLAIGDDFPVTIIRKIRKHLKI